VSAVSALELEVQRQLGRCLLRLQQYERLLKGLLSGNEVVGTSENMMTAHARNAKRVSGLTLGTLTKEMFETLLVSPGFERDLLPDEKTPDDRISFAFTARLHLNPDELERTRAAVQEMVIMRNELVHHFIDRFDLGTNEGCAAALLHLETCYEIILKRYADLRVYADQMVAMAKEVVAYFRTDTFRTFMVDGIAPDGSFAWAHCGAVRALREAWRTLSQDSWAPLTDVVAWVEARYPEQTPAKYGCRSWPQLVTESGQFDLRYRTGDGGRVGWLRERG